MAAPHRKIRIYQRVWPQDHSGGRRDGRGSFTTTANATGSLLVQATDTTADNRRDFPESTTTGPVQGSFGVRAPRIHPAGGLGGEDSPRPPRPHLPSHRRGRFELREGTL